MGQVCPFIKKIILYYRKFIIQGGESMKGLKKSATRQRKRVIAILLSALMVLSIIIPSGGSGVRYNAYAEGEESAQGEEVMVTSEVQSTEEVTSFDTSEITEESDIVSTEELLSDDEGDNQESDSEAVLPEEYINEEEILLDSENSLDDDNDEIIEDDNLKSASYSTNLRDYVTDADAKSNVDYDSSTNTWSGINLDNEYEFTIYFTEDTIRQFIEDNRTMTYTIPAGIVANNISGTTIDLVYKQSGSSSTIKVSDNPFRIENGVIYFNFNTDDANFGTLKDSDDAFF